MGVTYSPGSEYGDSVDVLLPQQVASMSWRTAKSLLTLRDQVDAKYPGRDKSSDGTIGDASHAATASDHNPDSNGVVHAMDISHDPAHGFDSYLFADILRQNHDPRIRYVISNRRIMGDENYGSRNGVNAWTWKAYNGSNPHDQHVHISVNYDARADDTRAWVIGDNGPVKPTPPSPSPDHRFTGITATVFGGTSDPNTSAYDGHRITDAEMGVALPYRWPKGQKPPPVRVYGPAGHADCAVVDVGPWNINDPYWTAGGRPQAESGTDNTGRHTNLAGIDLTPAAARAVGIDGKGKVDWEFVGTSTPVPTPIPDPVPDPITNPALEAAWQDLVAQLRPIILPILEKSMAPPTPPPVPQFDLNALLQNPLVQQLIKSLLPMLLPYIVQLLPQLLPALLGQKPTQSVPGPVAIGVGGASLGGIIGALLTAFLK